MNNQVIHFKKENLVFNNALQYSAEVYSEPCQKSKIEFFPRTFGYNFISNIYLSTLSVLLSLWSQAFLKRFKNNNGIIIKETEKRVRK